MDIYDAFAVVASIWGVASGIYYFTRIKKFKDNRTASVILMLWGMASIYIGIVYFVSIFEFQTMNLVIGIYLRPAIMLILSLPALFLMSVRI